MRLIPILLLVLLMLMPLTIQAGLDGSGDECPYTAGAQTVVTWLIGLSFIVMIIYVIVTILIFVASILETLL